MRDIWHRFFRLPRSFPTSLFVSIGAVVLCFALLGIWYLWVKKRSPSCSGDFDLVIVGAEIIDGLGGTPFKADIGIRDKHIVCVGTVDPKRAAQMIDGKGLEVAPGFIDVHTHVERNVPSTAAPFLAPN